MALLWIHEETAKWDADKERIVGAAPAGVFDSRYRRLRRGELVPGEWFRVEDRGRAVGYGWLDVNWGDAEILLATDPECSGQGIGTFILEHLQEEARHRGLNYLCNVVRPTHPRHAEVTRWLERRGFKPIEDGRLVCAALSRPSLPSP